MNNAPLLHCFDADARRYAPDMAFDAAVLAAEAIETAGIVSDFECVAAGAWENPAGNVWHLRVQRWHDGRPYRCWYGSLAWVIDGAYGYTPAAAIAAAQRQCVP